MAAISLVIKDKPQVWVPVTINAPHEGGFSQFQIELSVELETRENIEKIFLNDEKEKLSVDERLFNITVKDWRGIGSDDNTPLKFTKPNVKKAIAQGWFLEPCAKAVLEAHRGIVETLEKN